MQFQNEQLYCENHNAYFYKKGKYLYKLFKHYIDENEENQIVYNHLIRPQVDQHIILPKELLYNEKHWLIGYEMDFVKGINLEQEINNPSLSFEEKVFYINEFFRLLKNIHWYLTVGDIRNSNLMIGDNNNAYMIDFDFAKPFYSTANLISRYHIYFQDQYLDNKNEDIIKLYISALSLLYNYNIENNINGEAYLDTDCDNALLSYVPLSGFLKDYYYYIIECLCKHQDISTYLQIPFNSSVEKEINTAKTRLLFKE